jgi:HAD superfamily hydrolase (TIGR01490 family)
MTTTSPRAAAAFFDLDRTLIKGASTYAFALAAWRRDMMSIGELAGDARKAIAFRMRGSTDQSAEAVRDRILEAISGHPVDDLAQLGADIIPRLIGNVRPEARGLVDLHLEAGRDTFIVTATPIEIVDALAVELGMTGAIGTVAERSDGRYTGRLAAPFCYGAGKAEMIRRLAAEKGYDLLLSYAYSDSASDLPMLEAVGHPVAVNPDQTLLQVARSRGWPIVEFSTTAKRVVLTSLGVVASAGTAVGTYFLGRSHGMRAGAS